MSMGEGAGVDGSSLWVGARPGELGGECLGVDCLGVLCASARRRVRRWSRLDGWMSVSWLESAAMSLALPGRKMEESMMLSCQLSFCCTLTSQSDGWCSMGEGSEGGDCGGG